MKTKTIIIILAAFSLLFGIIGFVLSFLPLGLISILPALLGLVFWAIAYFINKKSGEKSKILTIALVIAVLAILISAFSEIFIKDKVAEDQKFEEKIEQSEEEALDDLEEALEDLEDLEDLDEE